MGYAVESANYPYLGGEGFLTGKPVVRVILRDPEKHPHLTQLSTSQLVAKITACLPNEPTLRPRWCYLAGDQSAIDTVLHSIIRQHFGFLVYTEVSGVRPMVDKAGHMPLWEHCCVRLRKAAPKIADALLFHSIVVNSPASLDIMESLTAYLDKHGFKVERYLSCGSPEKITAEDVFLVTALAHQWRITTSIFPKPIVMPARIPLQWRKSSSLLKQLQANFTTSIASRNHREN